MTRDIIGPVGCSLQFPLNEGIHHVLNDHNGIDARIKQVAAILLFPVWIVPAVALWFVGKTITVITGFFLPRYNSAARVNFSRTILKKIPKPIHVPSEDGRPRDAKNLQGLIDKVGELSLPNHIKDDLKIAFANINANYHINNFSEFDATLFFYLEKISQAMENGTVQPKQGENIFLDLVEAFRRYRPTWLETAEKKYQEVYGEVQSIEDKLLRSVQEYKEELFIELNQVEDGNRQWHGLNKFRRLYGRELGFNTNTMHLDHYEFLTFPVWVKARWVWRYQNPDRLISAVQASISKQEDLTYAHRLIAIGREKGLDGVAYATALCDEKGYPTEKGIEVMLKDIGILT